MLLAGQPFGRIQGEHETEPFALPIDGEITDVLKLS